ncbi:MAG TPA: 1-deoxy-D-xylulose-5-phosphate synthase [Bacteroides sp.]|uniref:1-deoxy-D-xylulose-5-phosphate synthase n=1 Tax=Bacteroides pectinophilus CAG:437 TaxID=1263051 RepID=R7AQT6_9FIRM|nr:1-deoxy-D-xylulose-5-phosphate synthase [Bacteroides pectinophilus CAG:437]HBH92909.1 1-deoxy-D-xylulose-5-phosphate synthase [Bacteroides sp.]
MILDKINKPNDIKRIDPEEYEQLAQEIRQFLIDSISKTGGHLASNLGVVELTMALHIVFDLPTDKLIWDVGHQSYTHKILTGRKNQFNKLRKYGGMSGFPKRNESDYDAFDTGHSSTSISAGLGYASARNITGEDYHVISVIGDGALTGGMAYEALNNASSLKKNFIIVLNDNSMSISENVGGISRILDDVRSSYSYYDLKEDVKNTLHKLPNGDALVEKIKKTKSNIKQFIVPGQIFEDMGIQYLGPVDGHNIHKLIKIFNIAKRVDSPVLVHVVTQKGHGYAPAEKNPSRFHGIGPFDIKTGKSLSVGKGESYSAVFSRKICDIAKNDRSVVAITAAMPDGTGLDKFKKWFPDRFFDVGIAEEHAVTFSAGLAAGGMKPVFAVYSSFLQRAFDQILHDVCMQQLHVVFAIDRAGLVGSDGETHQGIFDLSFLSVIPNMTIIAPKNGWELENALEFALEHFYGPIAIRYPRGCAYTGLSEYVQPIEYGKSELIHEGSHICLMAVGNMMETALTTGERLKEYNIDATIVNARFVKPIDEDMICDIADEHELLVTLEENVYTGGFGEAVSRYTQMNGLSIRTLGIALPDDYIEHGNVDILKHEAGIDAEAVFDRIMETIADMKNNG